MDGVWTVVCLCVSPAIGRQPIQGGWMDGINSWSEAASNSNRKMDSGVASFISTAIYARSHALPRGFDIFVPASEQGGGCGVGPFR